MKQDNSEDARQIVGYYMGEPLKELQYKIKQLKGAPIISSASTTIADWEEFVD